jgi:uncharacterized protein YggL (DUF469 family)
MNRRERKAKHVGEFREIGFSVEGEWKPEFDGGEFDPFEVFHKDLCDYVDSIQLNFGGGSNRKTFGWVFHHIKRFTCVAPNQINGVQQWFIQRLDKEVLKFELRQNIDLWEDPEDEPKRTGRKSPGMR